MRWDGGFEKTRELVGLFALLPSPCTHCTHLRWSFQEDALELWSFQEDALELCIFQEDALELCIFHVDVPVTQTLTI